MHPFSARRGPGRAGRRPGLARLSWPARLAAAAAVVICTAGAPSAAAAAPRVSAPAQVRMGETVEVHLAGFRARARVSVRLAPTEARGGNCCGISVVDGLAVGADGRAVARFVWPAAYYRTAGGPQPSRPNAAWKEGETVDIEAYTDEASLAFARTTTVVRGTGGTTPPVGTITWQAPAFTSELMRLGGGAVPFDLVVEGSIGGTANLAAGSRPRYAGSPRRLYEITGPSGTLSFSLLAGAWTPRTGMTGPDSSLVLALAWPTFSAGQLRLPLLQAQTSIGLNRPSLQVVLSGALDGRLETGVARVAEWVLRRGYLPAPYQAASIASYLRDNLAWLIDAYRLGLDARQLQGQVEQLLAQAQPLAAEIGAVLPAPQDVVRVVERQARAIADRLRGALDGLYRFTVGRIAASAAGRPRPPRSRGARARAPLGLRSALRLRAPEHRTLRRARLARLTRREALAAARRLLRPPLAAHVGPLLTERRTVRGRHGWLTVAAGGLASNPVAITVVGPGYAAEAPLGTRDGVAAATIRLPRRPGTYRIGIADANRPGGARLAVATVRRR